MNWVLIWMWVKTTSRISIRRPHWPTQSHNTKKLHIRYGIGYWKIITCYEANGKVFFTHFPKNMSMNVIPLRLSLLMEFYDQINLENIVYAVHLHYEWIWIYQNLVNLFKVYLILESFFMHQLAHLESCSYVTYLNLLLWWFQYIVCRFPHVHMFAFFIINIFFPPLYTVEKMFRG